MKKSLMLTLLMASSPAVFAQTYSGTVNDLNTVFDPPSNIQGTICQNTDADGIEHSGTACRDGVAAARWMAEKYAKKAGKYLGCIDGFYQGVWDGYLQGVNPSAEMTAEAEAYVAGATMESAELDAIAHAQKTAETESADQIIRRYRQVVNQRLNGNQVLPDKTPNMPPVTFDGFEDGYVTDILNGNVDGGNFNDAINAGYVDNGSAFEDKIAARRAYFLQGEHARSLCDVNQTIFGRRGMPQLTIWDYFKAKRTRNFQNYGWKNGNWAWEIYDKEETNLDHYQNFKGLANKVVTETKPVYKTVKKLDANGQAIPVLNEDGTVQTNTDGTTVYVTQEVFSHNETITRKVNTAELKNLRNKYRKSFTDSYNIYFAKQYASVEYHVEGLAKYDHAKIIGKFIGEDVAQNTAKRSAYNKRYKLVSAKAYALEAEKKYMESFNRLISIFENNPVVELTDARVIGTTKDDIYTPGEQLTVALSVTNLGEVARPVTMRVDNSVDIIANQSGHEFTPASLDRTDTETGVVGTISHDNGARDQITVNMRLDNPSNLNDVSSELVVSKAEGIVVREYTEVRDASAKLNYLMGTIDTDVQLINPAREGVDTPSMPKARVSLVGTSVVEERNTMKIPGQGTAELLVPMTNLDPLTIIGNGGATVRVESILGNKITDSRTLKMNLGVSQEKAYANYFNALLTNQTSNTGNVSKDIRVGQVIEKIEAMVDYVLANRSVRWRRQNESDSTIIGDLQRTYNAAKAARLMTKDVQAKYTELAYLLAQKIHNRGSSRVTGLDKHYLRQLKKFAPSMSSKPRHHKR